MSPQAQPASPDPEPVLTPSVPGRRDRVVTVVGTVAAGVETGCLLLQHGEGPAYLLLGTAAAALQPGQRVRVTGVPRPGAATTCQQGRPLAVVRAVVLAT